MKENLEEALGILEKRTIEEARSRHDGEIEHEVSDGDAGTRRRSTAGAGRGLRPEDTEGKIFQREVGVGRNLDERFQAH